MNDFTQIRVMAWWYQRVISFTRVLDSLNRTEQPVFAAVNEGVRRMCKEAIAYISEITPTEEMPAVDSVVIYDAEGKVAS